ncbi:hypothetical protein, partial [Porphyromonas sp.]|uniref:hypothetical protein n=1 Tax=Porphyromonas sp. TaxID=1924944 RepID=UPI0025806FE6
YLLVGYIPFARRVYTICLKGIYPSAGWYIPFSRGLPLSADQERGEDAERALPFLSEEGEPLV